MKHIYLPLLIPLIILTSCGKKENQFDATGSFEAEETIISAEANGIIKALNIEEGNDLKAGQCVGYIDTVQLGLKRKQVNAQINAILSKRPDVKVQLAALNEQLKTAERDQMRISNLVKEEAAPSKQLDDINSTIEVIKKQISAQRSNLDISTSGINKEASPLEIQIEEINDQIKKCMIINPLNGTVLVKYALVNEMAMQGKPLYKIADLGNIILRAYISGNQLAGIKLGQSVKVFTDNEQGGYKETEGKITWISDKAEFTPKTIQTKDERADMVYAIKVRVKNDGTYKIGMYAEIKF